jgi:hypothetical protein
MTARDTLNSSISSAETTKAATLAAAELTKQETINAQGCNVGLKLQNGNSAYVTAIANANAALFTSRQNAEIARQASLAVARDTLRNAGTDNGAF